MKALAKIASSSEIELNAPQRGKQKRSYQNRKIQCAIDKEIAAGGSMETLHLLMPAERRRRLNEHLAKMGVREKEMPAPRSYQRYFNGR